MSNLFAISFTISSILFSFFLFIISESDIFSAIVKVSSKLKSWNTNSKLFLLNDAISLSFISVISLLLIIILPAVTVSIVEMQFKSVVFPLPLAPIIATNSPSFTVNEILSIAFVILFFVP